MARLSHGLHNNEFHSLNSWLTSIIQLHSYYWPQVQTIVIKRRQRQFINRVRKSSVVPSPTTVSDWRKITQHPQAPIKNELWHQQLLKTNQAEKTGQKYSGWYELQKIRRLGWWVNQPCVCAEGEWLSAYPSQESGLLLRTQMTPERTSIRRQKPHTMPSTT